MEPEAAPARVPARDVPPPRDRAARDRWLVAQLDALVAARPELGPARVGISVIDAGSGRPLYARNAAEQLKVASNAKVITAIGALAVLGPEYVYRTALFADALSPDGVVTGNLYLRGSGDPSLDTQGLWSLVHDLELLGVKRVTGALVVDDTLFDAAALPPVFDEKQEDAYFRAAVTAAASNDGAVLIWVRPGATAGAPARVVVDPPSSYFVVKNTATTLSGGRAALGVTTQGVPGATEITVTGTIRLDRTNGEAFRKRVEHPSLYTGHTLRALLDRAGIKIGARVLKLGAVPRTARSLVTRQSLPVGVLVREMSKRSNNFMAEALLKTIAVETGGAPGSWQNGLTAVRRRLGELGVPASAYRYENGSGLYSSGFFGAETLTAILREAARDFRYGPDLIAALAIAGADGTLRHRMAGGPAERYVRAKSGSLRGVTTLAGFAGGVGRPLLAFAVLVNDLPDAPAAVTAGRSLADAVAVTLVRYLEAE